MLADHSEPFAILAAGLHARGAQFGQRTDARQFAHLAGARVAAQRGALFLDGGQLVAHDVVDRPRARHVAALPGPA
jgi:hypothetical protein